MGSLVILGLAVLGVLALISLVGSVVNILIGVIIWGISGALASRLMGGDGAGLVTNVLLGVIGGVIGGFVLRIFGLGGVGNVFLIGHILVGVVGAVIVIVVVRAVGKDQNFAR